MGRIIDVVIYCANSKNRYKAFFEEKQPGKWYGIGTEKLEPLSFFKRFALKMGAKKGNNSSPYAKVGVGGVTANVQGTFYLGNHKCPFCGNTNYVKCHVCREWTCNKNGATQFKCAVCGNSGKITGTINAASGNLSQGQKSGKKF